MTLTFRQPGRKSSSESSELCIVSGCFKSLVVVLISQQSHDVIGRLSVKGPLQYLVTRIRGCHARAILLLVVRTFFARFLASRRRPVAGSSRR